MKNADAYKFIDVLLKRPYYGKIILHIKGSEIEEVEVDTKYKRKEWKLDHDK